MNQIRQYWRNLSLTGKITSLIGMLVLVPTLILTSVSIERERNNFQRELESQSDLML
jgi:hypothetical protein